MLFRSQNAFSRFSYDYNVLGNGRWDGGNLGMGWSRLGAISECQVAVPSDMITLGDSGSNLESDWLLNPNEDLNRDDSPLASWLPSQRHSNGANILFCDGHVEFGKQRRWIEKKDQACRRWNNDHQPHPKNW